MSRDLVGIFGFACFLYVLASLPYCRGFKRGAKKQLKQTQANLAKYRTARIERWTPTGAVQIGEPGTPRRLVSDYEDAVYAAARHAFQAGHGLDSEHDHALEQAQLAAEVRRLRGEILALVDDEGEPVPQHRAEAS